MPAPSSFVPKSAEEVAEMAKEMRRADPNVDDGKFDSLKKMEAFNWLKMIGVTDFHDDGSVDEEPKLRLRRTLWDIQRIDNIFPGTLYSSSSESKLDIEKLQSWKDWKKPRPELNDRKIGKQEMDMRKDEKRMNSYVVLS
jgi:hypothetical protein